MSIHSIKKLVHFDKNRKMLVFGERLAAHLKGLGLTPYQLALKNEIDPALLNKVINGKRTPSDGLIEKLAAISELGLPLKTLQYWRAIDILGPQFIYDLYKYLQTSCPEAIREVAAREQADRESHLE